MSKNEDILNSSIFLDFIQIQDKDQFLNKQKEYNKLKCPSKINEYKTMNGTVKKLLNLVEIKINQRL